MPKTPHAKIAVSLPQELLDRIEARRLARGETRSETIREAVERLLKQEQVREWEEMDRQAYLANPETPEDVALYEAIQRTYAAEMADEFPFEWDED
ncbi:MAG: ribbon-helix-helix protein, CopG family [Chloroflexi bacterium]|nr:ribbon-helix-helix protein, CopG family [Chloroflexota bacterium]MDA1241062.1 ribbon-helix-helix protein, CopG family [Chloroflexota bacterium]